MSALTYTLIKNETEDDFTVVYLSVSSATDGDTIDISKWFKNIAYVSLTSSTKTPFGYSDSAGVITLKSDTQSTAGSATVKLRAVGN